MPSDVVTFGEAMVRLSPPHFERIEQASSLEARVGGGELNVAVGCARLGMSAAWVSRLPANPLGRLIRNKAREQGVDASHVVFAKDGRAGLYFLELGAAPRPSSVLYDRRDSSISRVKAGMFPWEKIFQGARLFHTSGITPALSAGALEATAEALRAARKAGLKVSYDLNYRAKLWTEEEAERATAPLMKDVDLLLTTEEDTFRVFKVKGADYREVARKLVDRFHFSVVAITLRENPAVWKNRWTAIAFDGKEFHEAPVFDVEIVDRVGAGDAFTAGFLYGLLTEGVRRGLEVGVAFSALKHSVPGDLNWVSLDEAEEALKGGGLRIAR